jgi:DNA replication and repair protein RecF
MYIDTLTLENFRSHTKSTFQFSPHINLIIGSNGSGKSNLLESIYFLSCGKSLHNSSVRELISWSTSYSLLTTTTVSKEISTNLEIKINTIPGHTIPQKKLFIDNVQKTQRQYFGNLKVVVFQPEDIRLVAGSPTRRRDFLDSVFIQTEWRYREALTH